MKYRTNQTVLFIRDKTIRSQIIENRLKYVFCGNVCLTMNFYFLNEKE